MYLSFARVLSLGLRCICAGAVLFVFALSRALLPQIVAIFLGIFVALREDHDVSNLSRCELAKQNLYLVVDCY